MSIFPLISSPNADSLSAGGLPMYREVAWDFIQDRPIWRGGNPLYVTGAAAVTVWAWNCIKTLRYQHDVFTHDYGHNLVGLVGKPYSDGVRQSEAIRYVRDALMINPYVTAVNQVQIAFDDSVLTLSFSIKTIYGEAEIYGAKITI